MQAELELALPKSDLGRQLKEHGQDRAAEHASEEWMVRAIAWMRAYTALLPAGAEFAIEDFRTWAIHKGNISTPPTHKVWGALPRRAIKAGVIEGVKLENGSPKYRKARSPDTRAHPVRIYRKARAK